MDEALGIIRCVSCGHRLEGEVECPFCSVLPGRINKQKIPKWVFVTASFLTSPLSLYFIITTRNLNLIEKVLAFSGCLFWFVVYQLI